MVLFLIFFWCRSPTYRAVFSVCVHFLRMPNNPCS
jgi:hypothetical protein